MLEEEDIGQYQYSNEARPIARTMDPLTGFPAQVAFVSSLTQAPASDAGPHLQGNQIYYRPSYFDEFDVNKVVFISNLTQRYAMR